MDFILIIERLSSLTKKEINNGDYPSNLSEIASIIRNVFLLSNNIRKDNNLIIFCTDQFDKDCKSLIIFFKGNKLRYIAPDERTTIFILQKVLDVALDLSTKKIYQKDIKKFKNNEWANSTPGISIKRSKCSEIWELYNAKTMLLLNFKLKINGINEKVSRVKLSDLENISMNIDNSTAILLNLNNNSEFSKEEFDKIICPNTQHIIIFENKKFQNNFFIWEQIGILQTIKSNTSD
jgi:tRNA pseudouridine-54 N-methylase